MTKSLRPFKNLTPTVGERVMIDPSSVVIGDVSLANDVSIWPLVAIRGDVNTILIGGTHQHSRRQRITCHSSIRQKRKRQSIGDWGRRHRRS